MSRPVPLPEHPGEVLVFDLETQRAFHDVEGRRADLLGLSLAVVYAYGTDGFTTYREADARALIDRLLAAGRVIGFNHRNFDLAVLRPYAEGRDLRSVRCTDLFEELTGRVGHRVGLDACARATLGRGKIGNGLAALDWYRTGRFDLLERYCRADVRLTRDLYDHGAERGWVLAQTRDGAGVPFLVEVPVKWPKVPRAEAPLLTLAGGRALGGEGR